MVTGVGADEQSSGEAESLLPPPPPNLENELQHTGTA